MKVASKSVCSLVLEFLRTQTNSETLTLYNINIKCLRNEVPNNRINESKSKIMVWSPCTGKRDLGKPAIRYSDDISRSANQSSSGLVNSFRKREKFVFVIEL